MSLDASPLDQHDERALGDFSLPLVAIVNIGASDAGQGLSGEAIAGIETRLTTHGGRLVANKTDGVLATFPGIAAASAFARELQSQITAGEEPWPSVGINLGAFRIRKDGRPGPDVAYAVKLRQRARPGEICISAVATNKLSSRVRPDGRNEPPGWRVYILPAVGLFCFLGYYFGWFYAIYWKIAYYVSNDQFPCWPEWMCR